MDKSEAETRLYFAFFNEIGIIAQLSGTLFERRLPEGFLVSHFAVLNHLVRLGDGKTPVDLARAFQVPKTTMTHTLSGLQKAGLIVFTPNPRDRRSKRVELTEAGRAFRDEAVAALGPDLRRMGKAIPLERLVGALPLLEEVRRYLDAARDGGS